MMSLSCGFKRPWTLASSLKPLLNVVGAHSGYLTRKARNMGEDPCEGDGGGVGGGIQEMDMGFNLVSKSRDSLVKVQIEGRVKG